MNLKFFSVQVAPQPPDRNGCANFEGNSCERAEQRLGFFAVCSFPKLYQQQAKSHAH